MSIVDAATNENSELAKAGTNRKKPCKAGAVTGADWYRLIERSLLS